MPTLLKIRLRGSSKSLVTAHPLGDLKRLKKTRFPRVVGPQQEVDPGKLKLSPINMSFKATDSDLEQSWWLSTTYSVSAQCKSESRLCNQYAKPIYLP